MDNSRAKSMHLPDARHVGHLRRGLTGVAATNSVPACGGLGVTLRPTNISVSRFAESQATSPAPGFRGVNSDRDRTRRQRTDAHAGHNVRWSAMSQPFAAATSSASARSPTATTLNRCSHRSQSTVHASLPASLCLLVISAAVIGGLPDGFRSWLQSSRSLRVRGTLHAARDGHIG